MLLYSFISRVLTCVYELFFPQSTMPSALLGPQAAIPHSHLSPPLCHPLVESVSRDVDGYFLQHWKFENEKARKKFLAAGFPRVTCLYFPKAQDDRIHFACKLLTVLFLIDGECEIIGVSHEKLKEDRFLGIHILRRGFGVQREVDSNCERRGPPQSFDSGRIHHV